MKKIKKHKALTLMSLSVLIILLLITILPNSFASLTPVKSISFESEKLSYEKNDAGSYKITKQAEWIGKGKARITFQVDTKELLKENINTDIILIIDTSGSMVGNKLDKVKSDSIDLINKILDNKENKIAIIEFNTNAAILSDFTNNTSELTDKINNLQATGETNYYQALMKLDEVLQNHIKEENKELISLFITDGYPGKDNPNQIGQYQYLKNQYPDLNIYGIQYEMGSTVLDAIRDISDKQFIANMSTLNNVLIDAAVPKYLYSTFEIIDYVNSNYFNIENKEDITTSTGKVSLDKETGKVTWSLDGLASGNSATMTIDAYLEDKYINEFNLYKTNIKEEVTSEIDGIKEDIRESSTPILSNRFTVSYDENTPDGCKVKESIPKNKQYSVFEPVKIEDTNLTCEGYSFQGWEIVNKEDVSMIGNSNFISNGNDITIRAIWSKVSLNKSMEGTVQEVNPVLKARDNNEFWSNNYRSSVTKIIIQNELKTIENNEQSWDVSEANDGSVMAYAVLNEDKSTYTIYIQGPGKVIANKNSASLFSDFSQLQSIEGLEYLDTSQVTNMSSMFSFCNSLTSLDLSSFNTSQVTDMSSMFSRCSSLTTLDLSNFDTLKVTNMLSMFNNCNSLTTLDISRFNTKNVTNMSSMFEQCSSLTNLNLSSFNTSQVISMDYMFANCSSLTTLDLSNFDTSKVTTMNHLFSYCKNLERLNISSFDTSKVTDMESMFYSCSNLKEIDVSNFNTSNVTIMWGMFARCEGLNTLNLSNFYTPNVESFGSMFSGCTNLKEIDFRNAEFNAQKYNYMFRNVSNGIVIVKDETARIWIQSQLENNSTAIIAS